MYITYTYYNISEVKRVQEQKNKPANWFTGY